MQAIPSEAEVLLPAGIALKVTSVLPKDASGQTIVQLEDDDEVRLYRPLPPASTSQTCRRSLEVPAVPSLVQAPDLVI